MKARESPGNVVKSQFYLYLTQTHGSITTPRPLSERTMSLTQPFAIDHDNPYLSDIVEDKIAQEQVTNYFLFSLVLFCFSIIWDGWNSGL